MKIGAELDQDQVLSSGEALPLQWNFYPDGRIRVHGPSYFKSKLGKTTVLFGKDKWLGAGFVPLRVEKCLFPLRKRGLAVAGELEKKSNALIWRRPTSKAGLWWPGTVKFSLEEAVFTDFENLLPVEKIEGDENKSWLEVALMGTEMPENKIFWTEFYNRCTESDRLKSKLRIDTYAWAFWGIFLNYDLIEKSSGAEIYYTSDRRIGEILSRLRGCGEGYLDFYFGHPDGLGRKPTKSDTKLILDILADIGFVPKGA